MATVEQSIDVNVPVRVVYDQWTQFEEFPRFMDGVKSVRQIDDTHLHWVAEVAGDEKEWEAEITEQHADERVAWQSTSGALPGRAPPAPGMPASSPFTAWTTTIRGSACSSTSNLRARSRPLERHSAFSIAG